MPNYSHTVHVPCQFNIPYIEAYIRSLAQGRIPIAIELELQVQLAANMVINALTDLNLNLPPGSAERRILYIFTLPEFFFRTIATSGFDLLDPATRAALALAPLAPISIGSKTDIQIPATDSRMACTTIGLQVATKLTALAPPGSPIHKYLMDSVLFLGSAVMYAGHYHFEINRTGRKVDNLAIVLRLSSPRASDDLPVWSVHLTWKIWNSTVDTMKSEKHASPDEGFGSYAPAPNQSQRAAALSRTFMHGAIRRTAQTKVRSSSRARYAMDQAKRTYLEAQILSLTQPPPREYFKRAAMPTASPAEVAQNRRMALEQLGLDSEKSQRGMEENAGNGTWLTSPEPALPSNFLQIPDAFTLKGEQIYIYTEICLDHKFQLFRFLSAFRSTTRVNLMVLISAGINLKSNAFIDLSPGTDDFIVFHNDGGGKAVHTGVVEHGTLKIIDLWSKVIDQTIVVQTLIHKFISPAATGVIPPMQEHAVVIGFSNTFRIL